MLYDQSLAQRIQREFARRLTSAIYKDPVRERLVPGAEDGLGAVFIICGLLHTTHPEEYSRVLT